MTRRFLLDTHVVVDLAAEDGLAKMPRRVQRVVKDNETELLISVVSACEIAIKNSIGRLDLTKEELDLICTHASIGRLPLRQAHADRLFALPLHHRDPFDRLIIASALTEDIPLISRDVQFRRYKKLRLVW